MNQDIIAAISTGLSPGGIGIVRVSGPGAAALCEPLTHIKGTPLTQAEPNHLYYGKIMEGETLLDEALICLMKAPRSYTAEETIELQCHGGPFVLQQILEAVLRAGARLAEPGEFTKRAFLNGRLDLSEAEAVMDLIQSQTALGRDTALKQLSGANSEKIRKIRAKILEKTAFLEAVLDDPEHFEWEDEKPAMWPMIEDTIAELDAMLAAADNGRLLAEGVRTAIVGSPNVGKSSLLNALLGFERAIVTQIPGTTRDTIEESFRFEDTVLRLLDTAGIREGAEEIEKIGIARTKEAIREADLILFVADGSAELSIKEEESLAAMADKPVILLLNKADLGLFRTPESMEERFSVPCFAISAQSGEGIPAVLKEIQRKFHLSELRQQPLVVTNIRHKQLLEKARESLLLARETLLAGAPEDLLTIDLMDAYRSLGLILGEEAGEDLINEIFSKFCMGK